MNIAIEVDSRQLEEAFRRAPVVVARELQGWVSKTTLRGERQAKIEVSPKADTGQLQNSIHSVIGLLKGEVKPTAKHAIFVEDGRRPGSKMPPFGDRSSLGSWARRKGIEPFVVARSIARKGIKPFPFMDKTYKTIKPIAARDGQDTLNKIVRGI